MTFWTQLVQPHIWEALLAYLNPLDVARLQMTHPLFYAISQDEGLRKEYNKKYKLVIDVIKYMSKRKILKFGCQLGDKDLYEFGKSELYQMNKHIIFEYAIKGGNLEIIEAIYDHYGTIIPNGDHIKVIMENNRLDIFKWFHQRGVLCTNVLFKGTILTYTFMYGRLNVIKYIVESKFIDPQTIVDVSSMFTSMYQAYPEFISAQTYSEIMDYLKSQV